MIDSIEKSRVLAACAIVLAAMNSCAWGQNSFAAMTLSVSADFDGGCALVESIDQEARVIRFRPEAYPDEGWAYWWYMHVDGIQPGETITLELGGKHGRFAHPEQAHFSLDGKTWNRTPMGVREKERITYRVKIDAAEAWFAWGPPFLPGDATELVERLATIAPFAEAFELTKSREGRSVPGLRFSAGADAETPRYGIWIQARQHAWECGGSWVARGLAEWLVSDDPRARTLREKADIVLVPLMDVDSVAMGSGGKGQKPRDHNRDWDDAPHWPEVRAAMAEIDRMHAETGVDLFLDLHSPGMYDPETYYLTSARATGTEAGKRNLQRFLDASHAEMTGPLKLRAEQKVADRKYSSGWQTMSQNWVTARTNRQALSFTLEAAWNNPDSTPEGYMTLGRQLGLAIERYLRVDPRDADRI